MAAFPRATALAVTLTLLVATAARAGTPGERNRLVTPSEPTYTVQLRSGGEGRTWTGTEQIEFRNTGAASLQRVWLRLWGNGLAGCAPERVSIISVRHGSLGSPAMRCTAYPIEFSQPLAPGARKTIELGVRIEVPARNDRFGFYAGAALMGNALPILAVREAARWHLDPYVKFGESFFSLSSRFRVTLDVPRYLKTPATGTMVDRVRTGDRIARTYGARDVRDFAWAAGRFRSMSATAGHADVRVWYQPGAEGEARDQLAWALDSMKTFSAGFGPYPYREVDVVNTSFTRFGGMEYPQIVFANPLDFIVSHEIAHQWWYGIVGNDQYAEPWLDESFATWAQNLPWVPTVGCSPYAWPGAGARLTNDMAYWSAHRSWYWIVYWQGACMLGELADRFGLARFERLLAAYAGQHRFGVATGRAFKARVGAAAAKDLPNFDVEAFWHEWRVG